MTSTPRWHGSAFLATLLLGACADGPVQPPPQPILGIELEPANVTVSPTLTATVTASISLGPTAGAVSVTVSDVPAGVSATVGTVTTTGNVATVDVQLAGSLAADPGLYNLLVAATTPGAEPVSTTLALTVADLAEVRVGNCSASDRPIWFAVQHGDGTMHVMQPEDDRYRFVPEGDHAGFYYVTLPNAEQSRVHGMLRTSAELLSAPIELCEPAEAAGLKFHATVTGGLINQVSFGGPSTTFYGNGGFTMTSGPEPRHDLIATKFAVQPIVPTAVLIRRNVPTSGDELGILDLSAGAPGTYVPESASMTFSEQPTRTTTEAWLHRGPECRGVSFYSISSHPGHPDAFGRYWGLPTNTVAADEWHRVRVLAHFPDVLHWITFWTRTVEPINITFGPPATRPVLELVAGGARPQFTLDVPPAYGRGAYIRYSYPHSYPEPEGLGLLEASYDWLAAEGGVLEVPDFSGLPGWNTDWAPIIGGHFSWRVQLRGGPGGAPCTAGVQERDIEWTGFIQVP